MKINNFDIRFVFNSCKIISLPVRQDMVINPDSGRPFSDLAVDYFDNGRLKVKGRYSGGYASGYWSYFYPNGQLKTRGRYYKAVDINPVSYTHLTLPTKRIV